MRNQVGILLVTAAISIFGTGCLYANVTSPLAWRASTPGEIRQAGASPMEGEKEVTGESCIQVFLWLFAVGDAGYNAAIEDALSQSPGATTLYDSKTDSSSFSILGLYQKHCSHVQGRPVRL